ncbi:GHKL domain-containing protein [Companilactobacillus sp. HBUAS56257]|uniref:GHKL domain-containing protein n=1 Tax=Companilactobacillus sp. HBUAS56257 TaxID=3109360 RepID=UPI002FF40428
MIFYAGILITPLFALIMFTTIKRKKDSICKKFYLINTILLGLLIELISSIISSTLFSKIYYSIKISDFVLIGGIITTELAIILLFLTLFSKLSLKKKVIEVHSIYPSMVLLYMYIVFITFIYFIKIFKAYTILISGILLFLSIQGIVIVLIFIYANGQKEKKFEDQLILEQIKNLNLYTSQLDKDQKEMHKFKHDYQNILNSLSEIAVSNDNDDLKKSLIDLENYSSEYFENISMDDFKDLEYISNAYIKSLLISKLKAIKLNKIDCYFECKSDLDTNMGNINIFDLIRILGVSIDNAIESVKEQKKGKIQILFIQTANNLEIIIKNTISDSIPMNKITKYGYSSKKNHSGLGMINLQEIKKKYPNLLIFFNSTNNWFNMQITITEENKK